MVLVKAHSATQKDEATEQRARFITYLHYLDALRLYLREESWCSEHQIALLRSGRSMRRLQRNPDVDRSTVSKYLRNSWATEMQLRSPAANPEMLGVANHWATVQLYYAIYLSLRALFVAAGRNIGPTHRAALRTIAADVKDRSRLFPLPWRVCCTGNTKAPGHRFLCLPDHAQLRELSNLTAVGKDDFWSSYTMLLRTTRNRQIDTLADEWKQQNKKKRLKAGGRAEIDGTLPPTTIFDFLYRLRIRSNYSDADSFLQTMEDSESARRFNNSLLRICWCTSLVLENLTSLYLGRRAFGQLVAEYCNRIGEASSPVKRRWELLRG